MRKTLWAAAALAASSLISFRSTYEPDLWWHLAQGREIAAGHLVRTNLFSAGYADYRQHYTSWLFDAAGYVLWTHAGPAAIQAAQALALAATLLLVAAAVRVRSSIAAAFVVCLFGFLVLEPRALPRPYLVSFAALASCTWLIERARATRSWTPVLWIPLIVAIWSNVHVECVFGVALVGMFGAGEWLRPRALTRADALKVIGVAAMALAATAVNPYGIGLLRYFLENTLVPQVITIAEVQPPYLPNYRGFFAWSALCVVLLAWQWRRVSLAELIAIIVFAVLGFRYLRLTPLLFIVAAPTVAAAMDVVVARPRPRQALAAASVMIALLLTRVPVTTLVRELRIGGDALEPPALFSPAAMQFARDRRMNGPVFTSINLGGYVEWCLYPDARAFLDARLQAYPPEHFRAIRAASSDPAAWKSLTRGLDWAVLSRPRVNEWSGVGRFDPNEWGTVFEDPAIEILVRRDGRYRALLSSF